MFEKYLGMLIVVLLIVAQCFSAPNHRHHFDSSSSEEDIWIKPRRIYTYIPSSNHDGNNVAVQSSSYIRTKNAPSHQVIQSQPLKTTNHNVVAQSSSYVQQANNSPNLVTEARPIKTAHYGHYDLENVNRGVSTILNGVGQGRLSEILRGSFMFTGNGHVRHVADGVLDSIFGRRYPSIAALSDRRQGFLHGL